MVSSEEVLRTRVTIPLNCWPSSMCSKMTTYQMLEVGLLLIPKGIT